MLLAPPNPARLPASIGGKAAGLYRLHAVGVRVPDFAVLPADTFTPADQLLQFRLSDTDRTALVALLEQWNFPQEPVVVRSSGADEDGQHAAFAGLMDSFLNLTTLEAVEAAIARCAASAYSDRALAYRRQKGLPLRARPAVIVQRQVAATASGVLFSTFPEYPQELAVHAVWGFGEGLVGGALQPDEFYFSKQTGRVQRQQLAPQQEQLVARPAGGLGLQPVPAAQQAQPCLAPAQLAELFAVGQRLEQAFGGPQDVEFVVDEHQQLWVVQARPITQPIPEVVVYDNSNIQESYCGVTTPLTFSFAQRAYATVYRQTMRVLGLPAAEIAAHEPVVAQLLGLVKGRIYYHINHWYRGLQLLPSFRQNKADMERMMGLEEPVDFVTDQHKTLGAKLRLLPGLALNLLRLLRAFARLNTQVPAFHQHFEEHYRRFYALPLAELSPAELLNERARLDEHLLGSWTTPIINDFFVMMTNGRVGRGLQRAGIAAPDEFLSRFLAGDDQLASTQPTHQLQALARLAAPHPVLRQLLLELPPNVHQQVEQLAPEFHAAVVGFIGQYGDRTVGELKLETLTMRVEPAVFYKYLRNFLLTEPGPATAASPGAPLHEQARRQLTELLARRPFWTRRRLERQLRQLRQAIRYREALRLERTRLFGMYRALYLASGEQLRAAGPLAEARDVFWLTEPEITAALTSLGGPSTTDFRDRVRQRRQEFAGYALADVPSRVSVPSPPLAPEAAAAPDDPHLLRGTGCYPGAAEGEIIVITDPADDLNVSGKIVCALRTDPGWAALFPMCRGVIIEKGSSLSHSVILLRELGIPTIINVPGLTKRLQTGQHVRLNGETGEIHL
ncbi:PEP/pyruvate-binding domain-containing protein [Hymenobacter rubripertinctus]|uniref:Phosphoenolpyruvate synthase n=1 Tax=Hymenobacter rubripertinctus TaxID=2029981 RepID=A0A418QXD8_9BACT|nr:PEP/pyruvate-binding domain-containing protein [Hymenobacter rubripertinctus]RIY09825.1 phosphoenolpyruvate synthase [Hymenobacter rubripertinctus]